ncbi:MAG: hypothetical protein HYX75_20825 [Acidobacteria bacterium]|nr:hypothetical protein [Acidobacteriota bacterium]
MQNRARQGCGKAEVPIWACPFRTKPQMAQISAQITRIRPAFNRRATSSSLSGRPEAICDVCESICGICGFRDFAVVLQSQSTASVEWGASIVDVDVIVVEESRSTTLHVYVHVVCEQIDPLIQSAAVE